MPHVLAQELREAVLQAAIQGKLTEQIYTDSNANENYKVIKDAHSRISPCKSELDYSSMDFEIPSNWVMTELNELFDFVDYRGKTPNKTKEGVFLITASNIRKGYMDYTRKEYISEDEYQNRQSRGITEYGDLLFTTEAPMGMAALCDLEKTSCGQRVITFKEYVKGRLIPKLYMLFILSPAFQHQLLDNCTGTTAKGIKADKLKHFLIPLPPIEEQARIVARVDELMAKIDEYEKIERQLTELHKAFPGNMRDAILQAAMQGKLTEQLESDGDVHELIARINTIRERGIKDKTIRKPKGSLTFGEGDIPFDIPINWEWMRFGALVSNCDGDRRPVSKELRVKSSGGVYPYYGATGAIDKVDDYLFDGEYLMIGEDGGNFFVDRDNSFIAKGRFWANNHVHVVKPIEIEIRFLKGFLDSCNLPLMGLINGIAVPKLNQENLNSIMVPIPPIEEQQRIVEKLDELLPLCDCLEKLML
ncbi:MAG: restriction endonuclease subunit S [Solobacterium sp.]|nr:restriction endonuclease subunit S [Solobacterium sp.]